MKYEYMNTPILNLEWLNAAAKDGWRIVPGIQYEQYGMVWIMLERTID